MDGRCVNRNCDASVELVAQCITFVKFFLSALPLQMLDKEPVCQHLFDFDFEKDGDSGRNGFHIPKNQRMIPIGELKTLVLE